MKRQFFRKWSNHSNTGVFTFSAMTCSKTWKQGLAETDLSFPISWSYWLWEKAWRHLEIPNIACLRLDLGWLGNIMKHSLGRGCSDISLICSFRDLSPLGDRQSAESGKRLCGPPWDQALTDGKCRKRLQAGQSFEEQEMTNHENLLWRKRIPVALKPCEGGNLNRISSLPIKRALIPKLGPGEDEEQHVLDNVGWSAITLIIWCPDQTAMRSKSW